MCRYGNVGRASVYIAFFVKLWKYIEADLRILTLSAVINWMCEYKKSQFLPYCDWPDLVRHL